jgi:hypothetical protein
MDAQAAYALNRQVAEALGYRVDATPIHVEGFDRPFVALLDPDGQRFMRALPEDIWSRAEWAGASPWLTSLDAAMSFVRQIAPNCVVELTPNGACVELNTRQSFYSGQGATDAERLCRAGLKMAAYLGTAVGG